MAKYRVLQKSFIGNSMVEEGAVIEYDGIPHDNLEPIDKAAKAAVKESEKSDVDDVERLKLAAAGGEPSSLDSKPAAEQTSELA